MLQHLTTSLIASTLLAFQLPSQFNFFSKQIPDPKYMTLEAKPAVVRVFAFCSGVIYYNGNPIKVGNRTILPVFPDGTSFEGWYSFDKSEVSAGYFVSSNGYIVTTYNVTQYAAKQTSCKEKLQRSLEERIARNILSRVKESEAEEIRKEIRKNSEFVQATSEGKPVFKDDQYVTRDDDGKPIEPTSSSQVMLPNGEFYDFSIIPAGIGEPEDVAVIKIAIEKAPTLRIGKSEALKYQESVTVIGYPLAGDELNSFKPSSKDEESRLMQSLGQASVTPSQVANPYKKTKSNASVLQLSTPLFEGSAGSPVLNAEGEVVGMVTSRSTETSSGQNLNVFAVPSDTILDFVKRSGSSYNQEEATNQLYHDGLELFKNEDFAGAKAKFEQVAARFPQHSEAKKLIEDCNERLDQNSVNQNYIPWLLGFGGVIVALVALSQLLKKGDRQKLQQTAPTWSDEYEHEAMAAAAVRSVTEPGNTFVHQREPQSNLSERWRGVVQRDRSENGFSSPSDVVSPPNGTVIAAAHPFLELENAQGRTQQFSLCNKQHKLGRDRIWADLDVPEIGWEIISKHHAILRQEDNEETYRIFDGDGDKRSTNGIFINNMLIPSEGYLLQHHDQLIIGRDPKVQVKMKYCHSSTQQSANQADS